MIPGILIRVIAILIVSAVALGLLYLPIAILRNETSIHCNVCFDYWISAFILASISVGFGYYIQIILMVLFYKGLWQTRKGIRKFYSYISIIASISVIIGGTSIIMANSSSDICSVCQWSSATSIGIYIIFIFNVLIIIIKFCCLNNRNNANSTESMPLNTKKSKTDVIVIKRKKSKSKLIANKSKTKLINESAD